MSEKPVDLMEMLWGNSDDAMTDFLNSISSPTHIDEDLPVEFPDLIQMIEDGIEKAHQKGDRLRMGGFHPSFISGRRCFHAYYLHRLKEKRGDLSLRVKRVVDNGTAVHNRVQKYLAGELYGTWICRSCHGIHYTHSGFHSWLRTQQDNPDAKEQLANMVSTSNEPKKMPHRCSRCSSDKFRYGEWRVIDDDLKITGEIDGILKYKGETFGLEIKSASSRSFPGMLAKTSPYFKKYVEQFSIYLKVLGIKYGLIYFENKDNQTDGVVPIVAAEVDLSDMQTLIKQVNHLVANGLKPPFAPEVNRECGNCPYYGIECQPEQGVIDYENTGSA